MSSIVNSDQIAAIALTQQPSMDVSVDGGKVRSTQFSCTIPAGDAATGSTLNLVKLPGGRVVVKGFESHIVNDTGTASAKISIGNAAATARLTGLAVAANSASLAAATQISAVGSFALTCEGVYKSKAFDTLNGVVITATTSGATIPAASKIGGYITYVTE